MRVITIQDEGVLKVLEEKGYYIVDKEKSDYKFYGESYDIMIKLIYEKYNIEALPIWGFSKVQGLEPENDLRWDYYKGKGGDKRRDDEVLIELEIDDNDGISMNYYEWTDIMYYLEAKNEELVGNAYNNLFNLDRANTIQVCIPILYPEMIKGIYK